MVRDHEEHGASSTFHHSRYHMAHVFESIILPHITDHPIHVYYENLDWGTAEPKELARAFSLLVKLPKSNQTRYSIIIYVTLISRLFLGNCQLAT